MDNSSPKPSSIPVIEMRNVSVGSAKDTSQIVLEEVNWTVNAGEFWVIGGMHASGKTDLMWMTDGIVPPQGGTYRLFGNEMPVYGDELLAERLRVGLVFDHGQLLRHMNVHENIALPLRYHRNLDWQEIGTRVKSMLEKMELAPYAQSTPGTLALDWQKRAGLGRALMLEPELLLLDHPLSGLDFRHTWWWIDFLRQWHAQQTPERPRTVVVTIEDLRPWKDFPCHFAILQKKRFINLGHRPKFHEQQEPLVKELLAEHASQPINPPLQ